MPPGNKNSQVPFHKLTGRIIGERISWELEIINPEMNNLGINNPERNNPERNNPERNNLEMTNNLTEGAREY